MKHSSDIRNVALGAILAVIGLSANAAVNLTTFAPNTPIKSSEVNANFSSLKANLEALQAPIGVSRLDIAGTAADGKVLKLQAGNLAWADDLTGGSGGAAYSAGTGLALTNTTFSLADGGVTLNKLSATGGTDGKVLKISGGKLTWLDDIVGSPGNTYTADDSSLALSGTKFSVKDGGIGTTKIADGAINGAKIAPGAVTGNKFALPLSLKNADDGTLGLGLLMDLGNVQGGVHLGRAILGRSNNGVGVSGESQNNSGVVGISINNDGVLGSSDSGRGVAGISTSGQGVWGQSGSGVGVYGNSIGNTAIFGENNASAETLRLTQHGAGALIDAHGPNGNTVFSVDNKGNVFSGTNSYSSDRFLKTNFSSVNPLMVLERVAAMPMTRWNYKRDVISVQHIGPMAQDFHAAFGLNGSDDTRINAVDANGVAFAAIKGLNAKLQTENASLLAALAALEARLEALEKAARPK